MGMFDWYEPTPDLTCPHCGATLKEWQGKDGPCALFVWRQGERHPVDQRVDEEVRLPPDKMGRFELPPWFIIYSFCCNQDFPVEAICEGTRGAWTTTRLAGPDDIETIHYLEPKARRQALRAWLAKGIV